MRPSHAIARPLAVALALASGASAVGRPGVAAAQPAPEGGVRVLGGWRAATGVDQAWDSNAGFAGPDGATPDLVSRAFVDGARLWRTPRSEIAVNANGAALRFRVQSALDRNTYGLGARATRQLTRRTTAVADLRAASDLGARADAAANPLFVGLATVRTQSAAGALTQRLTRRVDARLGVDGQRTSFDAPGLVGGWVLASSARALRRGHRGSEVAGEYEFRRGEAAGFGIQAHRLSAAWLRPLSAWADAQVTVGLLHARQVSGPRPSPDLPADAASAGDGWRPAGGAALRLHPARGALTAEYQRSVGQIFGFSRPSVLVTDLWTVGYQHPIGDRVQVSAAGRRLDSVDPAVPATRLSGLEASADVRYAARWGLTLSGGGAMVRRRDVVTIRSARLTLGAGYVWSRMGRHTTSGRR